MELTKLLRANGITYKWLITEDIFFQFQFQRYNINSIMKAEYFMEKQWKWLKRKGEGKTHKKQEEEQ